MSDYINHKEYKLPNGRTVTADFNELGHATVTIQAMDALFDILNSSDVVEVVRCNECIHNVGIRDNTEFYDNDIVCDYWESDGLYSTDFCSYGERAEA